MPVARSQVTPMRVQSSDASGIAVRRADVKSVAVHRASFDVSRFPAWTVVPTDNGEVWMIGGIWPLKPGITYISGNGPDDRLIGTSYPPGVIKRIRFGGATLPPGPGEFYKYTVVKNGVPTGCSFTVTGSTRKGGSDVQIAVNDGDEICVEVEISDGCPEDNHSGTVQFKANE